MSAKDEAQEIVNKYTSTIITNINPSGLTTPINYLRIAKQCALLSIDRVMAECKEWTGYGNASWYLERINHWTEVKQEIEKL